MNYEPGSREAEVIRIVISDPLKKDIIAAVAELNLPECWIAGGFVRNPVWEELFGKGRAISGSDVDVVYFRPLSSYGTEHEELVRKISADKPNEVWQEEDAARLRLEKQFPGIDFEVKNQARMYMSSRRIEQHEPYRDMSDALKGWTETATASGIRREQDGTYSVFFPWGSDDLFGGIVRPSREEYIVRARERATEKGWFELWPSLKFVDPWLGYLE